MSEKPFWEGKTCEEMAGLPVKAVFKNGVTITGQLSRFGGIPISTEGMNSPISISSNTLNFRPHREISSVELLDSLEYERIDNIEDVHAGDIFVAKSGNRYDIRCVDPRRGRPVFGVSIEGEVREWIGSKSFAYALRLKLRLPDEPGLWLDKDDNTWMFKGGSMNIHPIIDEPPSFPQTVLRLLTGSTHCCDWCEKRWIKVHRTGQLECRNRRCPYCGQYGCPRAEKHWKKCPVWNHMTPPAWLYPVLNRLCERDLQRMAKKSRNDAFPQD